MKTSGGCLSIGVDEIELGTDFTDRYPGMAPGNFVRMSVCDTGSGIAPEIVDRIFDPFFTTKAKGEGTGMGLSVVHGIVSKLAGTITVSSSPSGTRFNVYLPRARDAVAKDGDQETRSVPKGSEKVVLVDDEDFLVDVGTQMLESLGYHVTGFTSSPRALEFILANADLVDLLITDMTMPELTGMALASRLFERIPDLPIIICTGYSEQIGSGSPELSQGIRGVLMKPVLIPELAGMIRKVLDADRPDQPG